MNPKILATWFRIVSVILVLFGLTYTFFGLKILPVSQDVLLDWESALYGAIMTGWGVTLLLVGRVAFQRNDADLLKALLYGLTIWLILEALLSAYLRQSFSSAASAAGDSPWASSTTLQCVVAKATAPPSALPPIGPSEVTSSSASTLRSN
jgi:hypothetical protein